MLDAVVLANYIDALPDNPTTDDIEKSFLAYKGDRIEWVEDVSEQSKLFRSMVDKVSCSRLFVERMFLGSKYLFANVTAHFAFVFVRKRL